MSVCEKDKYLRSKEKQEIYTMEATLMITRELKSTLENLSQELFGTEIQYKWVDAHFPFTHPSWELEILLNNTWIEMLGCGIIEHKILEKGKTTNKLNKTYKTNQLCSNNF